MLSWDPFPYGRERRRDELPEELARRETRLEKIREAKRALEERAREQAKRSPRNEPFDCSMDWPGIASSPSHSYGLTQLSFRAPSGRHDFQTPFPGPIQTTPRLPDDH